MRVCVCVYKCEVIYRHLLLCHSQEAFVLFGPILPAAAVGRLEHPPLQQLLFLLASNVSRDTKAAPGQTI